MSEGQTSRSAPRSVSPIVSGAAYDGSGGKFPSEFGVVSTTEPIPWRGFRAIDKLIFVLLPLAAAAVVVLPMLDQVFLRRLARLTGNAALVSWLATGGTWIAGAGILLLLALFVLWRRQTLVGNKALWFSSGCPACGERELVRVSRRFGDRFYNLAAVPAYRYACRNCTWRGIRIGRREQSLEHEAELEAALLRFDPDARVAPADSAAEPGIGGEGRPRRAESVFRDTGDVAWDEAAAPTVDDEADNDTDDEPANNHAGEESPDDMEWIWVRPSGTDQL